MNKRTRTNDVTNKRMLSWEEAMNYLSLGRTSCRRYCERIGAVRKIGGRVLFDKYVIDADMEGGSR